MHYAKFRIVKKLQDCGSAVIPFIWKFNIPNKLMNEICNFFDFLKTLKPKTTQDWLAELILGNFINRSVHLWNNTYIVFMTKYDYSRMLLFSNTNWVKYQRVEKEIVHKFEDFWEEVTEAIIRYFEKSRNIKIDKTKLNEIL